MIALWWALTVASAHPLAPSVLVVDDTADPVVVTWREPRLRPVGQRLLPALPCDPVGSPTTTATDQALETTWTLGCPTARGRDAGVQARSADDQVIVEYRLPGETSLYVLQGDAATVELWASEPSGIADGVGFGIRHLFGGPDHVLFVLGLLLAVPVRRLVGAITAFTVGHGISLGVAGTGLWVPPSGPIEVGIALSLVWLAAELLGPEPSRTGGWLATRPAWLCLPFGLLHGLGFAGAWLESGLDDGSMLAALLGFNLGIELGQLALIALVLAAFEWVGRPSERWLRLAVWVGGAVAGMWVFERVLAAI